MGGICAGTQAYWDQININQQSLSFSCFYPWVSTTLRSNLFLQFHSSSSTWILILAPPCCCKTTPTLKHIMLKIKPMKPSNNLIPINLRESFKVQSKPTVQCRLIPLNGTSFIIDFWSQVARLSHYSFSVFDWISSCHARSCVHIYKYSEIIITALLPTLVGELHRKYLPN